MYWIGGTAIVLGINAINLYPLLPTIMREELFRDIKYIG